MERDGRIDGIDKLIRSRRRTLSVEIAEDARVIVRAPHRAPAAAIERFVREKRGWIEAKRLDARRKASEVAPKSFAEGEEFLYLGEPRRLAIIDGTDTPLAFDGTFHLSSAHTHHPRRVFINWYKEAARRTIGERLEHYTALSGLRHTVLRITDARTRWGSCSGQGALAFSWRLVMAPPAVIDYVVAHELTHLAEPNHSRRFWGRLGQIFPDYRRSRAWLAAHAHRLTIGT